MQHLESNDFISVIFDEAKQVTDHGIVVTKAEAILENEMHRKATVHEAPEFYTYTRNRGEKKIPIRTRCPVKAGDRVLINKYGGVGSTKAEDGTHVSIVRVHEVMAIIED